jgi:hypothetical protein
MLFISVLLQLRKKSTTGEVMQPDGVAVRRRAE